MELMLGDCLEKMACLEDDSIDMVCVDPPYGTTACKWDSIIPLKPMWEQLLRLIKPSGAMLFMSSQPFTTTLISSNLKLFKYEWIWDKHIPRGFQTAKYKPMVKHETVLVFGEGRVKYNPQMVLRDKPVRVKNYSKRKVSSNSIGKYNDKDKSFTYTHKNPVSIITDCWMANGGKVHPTQKPVSLMEYLIKTYTDEGDTVLDFAMGSGTTGIACVNLGRKFVGIESDPEYFNIARDRIESKGEFA